MTDIRYVILSDLHLGAENSVLTSLLPGRPVVDPHTPSPVLTGLLDCLEALISANTSAEKPVLVLAGDLMELALSSDETAAMVFELFMEAAFGSSRPLFDETILFVPGNHDHHLWETARELQYARYVSKRPVGTDLEAPWHTTRMRADNDPDPVESELLNILARRRVTSAVPVKVRVVYPNLALTSGDGQRTVVVHHGHFTESMYTLMSALKDVLYPEQRAGSLEHIWDWEAENFAWIDFFWSTLGRSGQVGTDVGLVYASLSDQRKMRKLTSNLARGLLADRREPKIVRRAEEEALSRVLRHLAMRSTNLERSVPVTVLSSAAQSGVRSYLTLPVRDQLGRESLGPGVAGAPEEVTLVFGHTHKPFEDRWQVPGYPAIVPIYNTGGWVIDTVAPSPRQGGAVILLDDQLRSVSVRVYNQVADGSITATRLATADPAAANPFRDRIGQLIEARPGPWDDLHQALARIVPERRVAQAALLQS